jgi:hypothetical protein
MSDGVDSNDLRNIQGGQKVTEKEKATFQKLADFVMEDKGSFRDRKNALTIMRNMILNDDKREEKDNGK